MIKLDDENENWMRAIRADRLKKRGWKGTVKEWIETAKKLGEDPLLKKPPITTPGTAKK